VDQHIPLAIDGGGEDFGGACRNGASGDGRVLESRKIVRKAFELAGFSGFSTNCL
jgi:hypothetical protein